MKIASTCSCRATSESNNISVVLRDASFMGDSRSSAMDIYEAVRQILARASLIELRDAIRTAERLGDRSAESMFRLEIARRLAE